MLHIYKMAKARRGKTTWLAITQIFLISSPYYGGLDAQVCKKFIKTEFHSNRFMLLGIVGFVACSPAGNQLFLSQQV